MKRKLLLILLLLFNLVSVIALVTNRASNTWGTMTIIVNSLYVFWDDIKRGVSK